METKEPSAIDTAIRAMVRAYGTRDDKVTDPIRGGERVEIPAGFALALVRSGGDDRLLRELLELVVSMQDPVGYWTEFPYGETDMMRGYAGAIPTSFSILALVEGYRKLADERYLEAARRGAHWLYTNEQNGYFLKAALNKSDVINTNLLAGYALLALREQFPEGASERDRYRFAAARAMRRAIASQFPNGAYPYISYGFTVPLLYQAMTTALMGLYARHFGDAVLGLSFRKGLRYLRRRIAAGGIFQWKRASNRDKEGAVWAYAWAMVACALAGDEQSREKIQHHLEALRGTEWFKGGDFDDRDDLFFTAWGAFSLSLRPAAELMPHMSRSGMLQFLLLTLSSIPRRCAYAWKILARRSHLLPDNGPAEEY